MMRLSALKMIHNSSVVTFCVSTKRLLSVKYVCIIRESQGCFVIINPVSMYRDIVRSYEDKSYTYQYINIDNSLSIWVLINLTPTVLGGYNQSIRVPRLVIQR